MFHKLTSEDIAKIAANLLKSLQSRLKDLNIEADFTDAAIKAVAEAGFDEVYGARPLRRAIQSHIEDAISEKILDGSIKNGDHITCDYQDGKFTIS